MTRGKELWGDHPNNNLRLQEHPQDQERQQCVRALRNVADEHSTPSSAMRLLRPNSGLNQNLICSRVFLPGQNIFTMTFAGPSRLYVGTVGCQVIRFDLSTTGSWIGTHISDAASTPDPRFPNINEGVLEVRGIVTSIAVDPADVSDLSVYITFGGFGDQRHVWHFDGTQWESRSGTGPSGLLDVETTAIVVDPRNPATVYVGTDVGVWVSTDTGSSWTPLQNGLPDSAVLDLQIHPETRLLRVSTHGRGMFELKLDPPPQAEVELYVRDTSLDVGRVEVQWMVFQTLRHGPRSQSGTFTLET
jgi:hypothetical protein